MTLDPDIRPSRIFTPFRSTRLKLIVFSSRTWNTTASQLPIVRAVIGLAQGLEMPVAGEGVETKGQLAILAHEGCTRSRASCWVGRIP